MQTTLLERFITDMRSLDAIINILKNKQPRITTVAVPNRIYSELKQDEAKYNVKIGIKQDDRTVWVETLHYRGFNIRPRG